LGDAVYLVALIVYATFFTVAFIVRSAIQKARTGHSGFHGIDRSAGGLERLGGVLVALGALAGFLAPILALTGVTEPLPGIEGTASGAIGLALALIGSGFGLAAQAGMGSSWRIGVDPGDRTDLVTTGMFAISRNPFFTGVLVLAIGLFLMVPTIPALVGFLALLAGVEIQVRKVEEPWLGSEFGEEYASYSSQVGRFLPGLGRRR